ncbi:MAG: sulfide/dihydroorotate dehydrogenase-like FAD/NAD-binding protein [Oscillospiraceae bacterium]|jgi:ferredoxin--NADP+ reductase|nr:sulfide/dihydroorotate dehydrogenase-like FAD/NAD-binding protein [Oscillospiraceae bacterium]
MYRIVEAQRYNPQVKRLTVEAPRVARRARPGQFVMVRVDERGERIPLTIADSDAASGRVTIIFQEVGCSTAMLGALEAGDAVADIVGPLGVPSHLEGLGRVCVVGGGLGCAIAYPQAKALFGMGAHVDIIAGFRSASLIFLEEEMRAVSHGLTVCTDDGSNGCKGLVTDILKAALEKTDYDAVIAIGPLVMMKFVCLTTKPYAVPTIVSMNPIMVDGTGMCGCCRVTVGGEVKFACVDGPDFDGHLVDFDEAMRRNTIYRAQEQRSLQDHICRGEERLHAQ